MAACCRSTGPWSAVLAKRAELAADGTWVAALALPILVSHQSEEWVRPGGFLPFCNRRLLGSDEDTWPLSERDGFHVNITIGWGSAAVATLLWRRTAAPTAAVLWLEASNAAMHSALAVRERRYNPGLATACLLMAPHALAGAIATRRSRRLSRRGAALAAVAGIAFSAGLPLAMKLRMRRAG